MTPPYPHWVRRATVNGTHCYKSPPSWTYNPDEAKKYAIKPKDFFAFVMEDDALNPVFTTFKPVLRVRADLAPCATCDGSGVVYETGLHWSEAVPCACRKPTLTPQQAAE